VKWSTATKIKECEARNTSIENKIINQLNIMSPFPYLPFGNQEFQLLGAFLFLSLSQVIYALSIYLFIGNLEIITSCSV